MSQVVVYAAVASARMAWGLEGRCLVNTAKRRRDKSGSPVAIQVPDRTCLSPCRSVESRAAPADNVNVFNGLFGTVPKHLRSGADR
jgi:hypothetical protein